MFPHEELAGENVILRLLKLFWGSLTFFCEHRGFQLMFRKEKKGFEFEN